MLAAATEGWTDLFVAAAGASAALAGLVFVAVSINVERILRFRGLPERAAATVVLLLGVVVVSLLALVPQSDTALGAELLAEALLVTAIVGVLVARARPAADEESHVVSSAAIAALGTLPFVVGGALLLAGVEGGLYWTFAGLVGAIVGGVANAWVLLVEILR